MADPKKFHASVLRSLDLDVVVDSSKSFSWILDSARWARRAGIQPVLVLTWKEPKSLAYSFYKRGPGAASIDGAVSAFLFKYGTALDLPLPKIAVRNERLRTEPEAVVTSLCDALGVSIGPGQHRFWEFEHHHLFGSDSAGAQVRSGETLPEGRSTDAFEAAWSRSGHSKDPRLAELQRRLMAIDESAVVAPVPPDGLGARDRLRLGYVYARQRGADPVRRVLVKVRSRSG